jgi:pimeloyl-ACP methyl ester carboxylesterase
MTPPLRPSCSTRASARSPRTGTGSRPSWPRPCAWWPTTAPGWGGANADPARDARTLATELRAALHAAGIPGPFVLAGHSFGWLPVRAFADLYREETAGLVAVDGSHPDQWLRWPVPHADRILRTANRATAVLARFGLLRVVDLSAPVSAGLPRRQRDELKVRTARPLTSAVEADQLAGGRTCRSDRSAISR